VLRDIERFKTVLAGSEGEPVILNGATRTLVTGPTDRISDTYEPLGDKIGSSAPLGGGSETEPIDSDHGDLFFPKPFNDDQVQIIRRLEKSDGLVVQGRLEPARRIRSPISFVTCLRLAVGSLLFLTVRPRLALCGISFPKACVI
jgi:hypothetical protein